MNTKPKQIISITLLALAVGTAVGAANARTVSGGADQCGAAGANRDAAVNREISIIKDAHEMMEINRNLHAECMKRMNDIVGTKISEIDSGGDGIIGKVTGMAGRFGEAFNLSGKVCKAITDKLSDKQKELADAIAGAEPFLKDAAEIYEQGREILGEDGKAIDRAVDKAQESLDKAAQKAKEKLAAQMGEGTIVDGEFIPNPPNAGGTGQVAGNPSTQSQNTTPPASTPMTMSGSSSSPAPRSAQYSSQGNTPPDPSARSGPAPSAAPLASQGSSTWESLSNIFNNPLNK